MPGKINVSVFRQLRYRLLLYLAVGLVLIMPLRTALEHHFLYFPEARHEGSPADIGLPYEVINFQSTDGTALSGWLVPGQTGAPAVLFCMGNAGNISHRLETLQLLHDLGVAVFIFDYRGYGQSGGKTSEDGIYEDTIGALTVLAKRGWPPERTIIFGRSLGAAVGLEVSLRTPPAGLVMESAFTSIAAMGRHHYPLLNLLLGWMVGANFNNLEKIDRLKSPLLLIHGKRDTICPPFMAEQLYEQAANGTQIHWISEADHNNGFVIGGASYRQVLQQAIRAWTGYSR